MKFSKNYLRFLSVVFSAIIILTAINSAANARASVPNRRQSAAQVCKAAIGNIVDRTTVGEPPVPLGRRRRQQIIDGAYSALQQGISAEQVEAQAYRRLAMIRNRFFRRDIARGLASVVSEARESESCK